MSPDGRWSDVTASNVNDEPDFAGLEAMSAHLVAGEYRVQEGTPDTVDQVCLVLDSGVPVGIGTFVDTVFEEWQPGDKPIPPPDLSDPQGGGHWFVVDGYMTVAATRVFRIVNSWGQGWGDAGHALVSAAFVTQAWDLYAVNVARKS
jgi:hypothetical protein